MPTPMQSEPDPAPAGASREPGFPEPAEDELVAMLAEAEAQVQHLREELERRRRQQHLAQHQEIDRLAEHLEKAQVNWQQVREFFRSAIIEYRQGVSWDSQEQDRMDRAAGPDTEKTQEL